MAEQTWRDTLANFLSPTPGPTPKVDSAMNAVSQKVADFGNAVASRAPGFLDNLIALKDKLTPSPETQDLIKGTGLSLARGADAPINFLTGAKPIQTMIEYAAPLVTGGRVSAAEAAKQFNPFVDNFQKQYPTLGGGAEFAGNLIPAAAAFAATKNPQVLGPLAGPLTAVGSRVGQLASAVLPESVSGVLGSAATGTLNAVKEFGPKLVTAPFDAAKAVITNPGKSLLGTYLGAGAIDAFRGGNGENTVSTENSNATKNPGRTAVDAANAGTTVGPTNEGDGTGKAAPFKIMPREDYLNDVMDRVKGGKINMGQARLYMHNYDVIYSMANPLTAPEQFKNLEAQFKMQELQQQLAEEKDPKKRRAIAESFFMKN